MNLSGNQFQLTRPKTTLTKTFKFPRVFDETATNADVYAEEIAPAVNASLRAGHSVSVIAFGARGTGKTQTTRAQEGVAMRAVDDIFASITDVHEAMVSVSALMSAVTPPVSSHMTGKQFTHEVLLDGMLPAGEGAEAYHGGLHVREHPRLGFYVEGLTEVAAHSPEECRALVARALDNFAAEEARVGLAPGAPLRVHCLVTFRVRTLAPGGLERVADVQVLDLAGWVRERPAPRGRKSAAAAQRPAGAVGEDMVVKAFLRIVGQLESMPGGHIPYRDSKLTRLLAPALGGTARCVLLMHVARDAYEETEAMLVLAATCARVSCSPVARAINYAEEIAVRRREASALLGASSPGAGGVPRAQDLAIELDSGQKRVRARDLLAAAELLERDAAAWAEVLERSAAFKLDGGAAAAAARVDRKPHRLKDVSTDSSVVSEESKSNKGAVAGGSCGNAGRACAVKDRAWEHSAPAAVPGGVEGGDDGKIAASAATSSARDADGAVGSEADFSARLAMLSVRRGSGSRIRAMS